MVSLSCNLTRKHVQRDEASWMILDGTYFQYELQLWYPLGSHQKLV